MPPRPPRKRYRRTFTAVGGGGAGGGPAAAAVGLLTLRRRRRAPRSKTRRGGYGRRLTRIPRGVPRAVAVKRNVFDQIDLQFPLDQTGMTPKLTPVMVRSPDFVWGDYSRGFDTKQVTSSQIRSRNVTAALRIKMPEATLAVQPFQFRIIQGFVKSSITGKTMSSTAGNSGMDDGIVLNFQPHTAYDDYALQVLIDNIGTTNGDANYRGVVNSNQIHVISDFNTTVAADGTRENPLVPGEMLMQYNRQVERTLNWKTGMNMKLFPYSINGNIPQVPNLTPVNNPRLWTPFVAVMILNNDKYTVQNDTPNIDITWSHYWQNL